MVRSCLGLQQDFTSRSHSVGLHDTHVSTTLTACEGLQTVSVETKMFSPTYVQLKYWFYPTGNTPAVNLLRDLPRNDEDQEDVGVLSLACGDARNLLFTLWCEQNSCKSRTSANACQQHYFQIRRPNATSSMSVMRTFRHILPMTNCLAPGDTSLEPDFYVSLIRNFCCPFEQQMQDTY